MISASRQRRNVNKKHPSFDSTANYLLPFNFHLLLPSAAALLDLALVSVAVTMVSGASCWPDLKTVRGKYSEAWYGMCRPFVGVVIKK